MCCTVREFFLEKGSSGELFIGLTFFFFSKTCAAHSMAYTQKVPRNNWGGIR